MQELTRKILNEKCKKITLPSKEQYIGEDIPFYEYITVVNGDEYRKLYIVDMTDENVAKLVQEKLKEVFSHGDDFFSYYFSDMFYESEETETNLRWEQYVIFMTDDNLKYYDPKIERDFIYIIKRFIGESDLSKLLQRQEILIHDDEKIPFFYNGESQNLSKFNIIYGENGSGKTRLIRAISSQFGVPVLNNGVDNYFMTSGDDIKKILSQVESDKLMDSYKRLWGYSLRKSIDINDISRFSDVELKLLMYAAKISAVEQTKQGIVLLDDIGWNVFDDNRTSNTIEYLSDLSLTGHSVVCATINDNTKELMYRKTYKPNIINLEKFD